MDYKEKYEQALDRAKEMYDTYRFSVDPSNFKPTNFEYIFPELKESEDERIKESLMQYIWDLYHKDFCPPKPSIVTCDKWIAWLEKQEDINSKEYVFRPLAGCCIESAATRAVQQQQLGHKVVLAFNGAYIPVEGKTANEIVKEYYSWLERQGDKEEPQVYETGNGEVITYSESEGYKVDEEDDDFIIYHPLKNGKGEYECISYSFYGSLTSFSEDKDLIDFLRTCFYTEEECNEWIERQKEQKPAECLKAEGDGWYVCIKDFYAGGKKQCSVGDLVQAKGGMYMMGKEDISEWFRRAYYEEVRDASWSNTNTNIPEQKSAEWSDEDEYQINTILHGLDLKRGIYKKEGNKVEEERYNTQYNWLKSLKGKCKGAAEHDKIEPKFKV